MPAVTGVDSSKNSALGRSRRPGVEMLGDPAATTELGDDLAGQGRVPPPKLSIVLDLNSTATLPAAV